MMSKIGKLAALAVSIVVATVTGYAAPAAAQATRTFISGVGDDANPCSRTAPCRTFAGAISKTATGGEINCLDPGGFGGLTITKSISVICDNTEGGVLVAGTSGFIVNSTSAVVVISGIDFEGLGNSPVIPGVNGVNILNAASVQVRNSKIRGFRGGYGINFQPQAGNSQLIVDNVVISESGVATSASTSGGINISPAAGFTALATITNTQIVNNLNVGIRIDTTGIVGSSIVATITDTDIVNNTSGILVKAPPSTGTAKFMLVDSTVALNSAFGIIVNTGTAGAIVARVSNTTITGNGVGVQKNGVAVLSSYGDNRLNGNTTDGAFSLPVIAEQ